MQMLCDFSDYRPWSGAVEHYNRIVDECGEDRLENALEQIFDGGEMPTATAINDLLWFEPESVYRILGMKPDNTSSRTLSDILEAWQGENERFGFKGVSAEILDCDTVRIVYVEDEDEDRETHNEDLSIEDVAGLFGDDEGEIDEEAQTVETWEAA